MKRRREDNLVPSIPRKKHKNKAGEQTKPHHVATEPKTETSDKSKEKKIELKQKFKKTNKATEKIDTKYKNKTTKSADGTKSENSKETFSKTKSVLKTKGQRKPQKPINHEKVIKKRYKKWKKRKPKDVSHSKEEGKDIVTHVVTKTPKKSEEFSANWKQLLSKIKAEDEQSKPKQNKIQKTGFKKFNKKKEKQINADTLTQSGPDIWFDDVDDILLDPGKKKTQSSQDVTETASSKAAVDPLVKPESFTGLTKCIAMDCEMVGVGHGGKDSIVARVSLVNQYGQCIYDKFVQPMEEVTDYRTFVSGVRKEDLEKGEPLSKVQKDVSDMMKGRILVGHAIKNDLKVLFLDHPLKKIRDTQRYKPFRQLFQGKNPSLKKLTDRVLGVTVQSGEHSSVQDAQAAMRLYTMYRQQWEKDLKLTKGKKKVNTTVAKNSKNVVKGV